MKPQTKKLIEELTRVYDEGGARVIDVSDLPKILEGLDKGYQELAEKYRIMVKEKDMWKRLAQQLGDTKTFRNYVIEIYKTMLGRVMTSDETQFPSDPWLNFAKKTAITEAKQLMELGDG